jgi:hypothetical protein
MYRIENVSGENAWLIVDLKNRVVFTGTMQQAEDWLDSQENVNRRPSKVSAWFRRLFPARTRPVDRLAGVTRGRNDRVADPAVASNRSRQLRKVSPGSAAV